MQFAIRCRYHRSLRGPAIAVRNIRLRRVGAAMSRARSAYRGRRRNVAVTGARPDRDSHPPWSAAEHVRSAMRSHSAATASAKRNSLPSRHMPCSNTASLWATATTALRPPIRCISARPQLCSRQGRVERRSSTLAPRTDSFAACRPRNGRCVLPIHIARLIAPWRQPQVGAHRR